MIDLDVARRGLASQPFSRLLGARLTEFGDGAATLELAVRDELKQQNGFLHGGVLAYAADNALTFAAGTVLGPSLLTAGFTIDYLRPAVGVTLRARAVVVQAGRARATCRCEVYTVDDLGAETLCAAAQGSARVARPRQVPSRDEPFARHASTAADPGQDAVPGGLESARPVHRSAEPDGRGAARGDRPPG
ncbi:MAG TPA: PaaI family thioesterase [Amycolatopsis sp.]|uniref:Medium/long-chain acyl-CoA thioesterase YigI n=1 Tax=Amycolatopsis nalaikhensis TaxID=715472 RepID=A0ABY8Y063_9PSEU|nr:PaaI family thioesterase [Amycolatopsis sp. 2-2]WIV61350.1 PaaI family thioesterase [Amycolatopsis sp. 2-2]